MTTHAHVVAAYPGSFDPVTHGHLDVIRRAAALFDELVIGVGRNPDKRELFSQAERIALLTPHIDGYGNVRAVAYDGLTIDFARKCGSRVFIRGIRNQADLASELQQANVNMALSGIETLFLMTSDQHVLTSSTYVKQIWELGGGDERLARLVPQNVVARLAEKLRELGGPANETGDRGSVSG